MISLNDYDRDIYVYFLISLYVSSIRTIRFNIFTLAHYYSSQNYIW